MESSARDFVADAFAHCKFIGYVEAALPLFEKAGIRRSIRRRMHRDGKRQEAKSFVDSLAKLRVWGREPKVKLP